MLENKTKKVLDLSDSYVILGSGLSAISTVHGIYDNKYDNEKKIFIIDAGLTKDSDLSFSNRVHDLRAPSPKFKIKANHYIYDTFKSMLKISQYGFEAVGSLAKGGLSNIWGGTIQPYKNEELSKFPYSFDEIQDIYAKILNILIGSKNQVLINNENSKEKELIFSDPILAINKDRNSRNSCNLNSCNDGCIICNKNIFNSKDEIDELINLNKIEYMPGLYIESIKLEGKYYSIKCIEIYSKHVINIRASIIYCCLGTISTSKIILGMLGKNSDLPLLTTPGASFFIFSFKNFHKKNHSILSSKSFSGKLNSNNYEGNIFPFSENLVCSYFGEFLGGILNFLFRNLIFSKLFIANLYFDSDMSLSRINYDDNGIKINAETTSELKKFFKKVTRVIKKKFLSNGLMIIPFTCKLLTPGQDIHYGGSIPMKNNPKNNQCNLNGELKGFKNFYISDASSMPYLASKGQSFNSMVNSYYIAAKSITSSDQLK